jgi:site-specific recombinase XerD
MNAHQDPLKCVVVSRLLKLRASGDEIGLSPLSHLARLEIYGKGDVSRNIPISGSTEYAVHEYMNAHQDPLKFLCPKCAETRKRDEVHKT